MSDEEKKALCVQVFNHDAYGRYYTRSIEGMTNCLIQQHKFSYQAATDTVQDFINQKIIIPTQTNDRHFILIGI